MRVCGCVGVWVVGLCAVVGGQAEAAGAARPSPMQLAAELELNLPMSKKAQAPPAAAPYLLIGVDRSGTIYVPREYASRTGLRRWLREAAARDNGGSVVIAADRSVAIAYLAGLLDACGFEGLSRVSLVMRDGGALSWQLPVSAETAWKMGSRPPAQISRAGGISVAGEQCRTIDELMSHFPPRPEPGATPPPITFRVERVTALQYFVVAMEGVRSRGVKTASLQCSSWAVNRIMPYPKIGSVARRKGLPVEQALAATVPTPQELKREFRAYLQKEIAEWSRKTVAVLIESRDKAYEAVKRDQPGAKLEIVPLAPLSEKKLAGLSIGDMVVSAARHEAELTGVYQQIRAIVLAVSQKVPLAKAMEAGRLSPLPSAKPDQKLLGNDDGGEVPGPELEKALTRARLEVDAMIGLWRNRLGLVQKMCSFDKGVVWGPSDTPVKIEAPGPKPVLPNLSILRPGRKVFKSPDEKPSWISVGAWQTVGPFELPLRTDTGRAFLPESVVDLDAAYHGRRRNFTWRGVSADRLPVVPPVPTDYGAWYAWTELHSDADRDVWMFAAADDYGRMWVNGKCVWSSGAKPSKCVFDRGPFKVSLRKGFNRCLFRLENTWGRMGFSVIVLLP